jgi:zinc protease
VLASDFDRGVALLAENELHPALPASAFKIIKRQVADSVAGELQSPAYLTQHALESALLPKKDPDLYPASSGSVSSLSLADVRNYYRRLFRPDLTTIVVIGNVTPERARSLIAHNQLRSPRDTVSVFGHSPDRTSDTMAESLHKRR